MIILNIRLIRFSIRTGQISSSSSNCRFPHLCLSLTFQMKMDLCPEEDKTFFLKCNVTLVGTVGFVSPEPKPRTMCSSRTLCSGISQPRLDLRKQVLKRLSILINRSVWTPRVEAARILTRGPSIQAGSRVTPMHWCTDSYV